MFALVSDIESYPSFLPWCQKVVIRDRRADGLTADLFVGAKGFQDMFTSHVSFEPDRAITVQYGGGALKSLSNEWSFTPRSDTSCEVCFFVAFELKSKLLSLLMDAFFDFAFAKMVHAFEARANAVYNRPDRLQIH